MNGMTQLMRHGRYIAGASLEVQQYIGCHLGQYRPAERTVSFAFTYFAVDMITRDLKP